MKLHRKPTPVSSVSAPFLLLGFLLATNSYGAIVASVDWDNSDNNPDGVITGTLGGVGVTLTTGTFGTDFPENGGVFLGTGTNWASNLGSDEVPGISDPGILNEGAVIDMGTATSGRTVLTFTQPVTNPTVLFNFVHDNYIQFYFDRTMPLLILVDSADLPGRGQVPTQIGDGGITNVFAKNLVFVNAFVGNNTSDSGFAVRLTGTFSEIGFDTSPGVNGLDEQTVGFTVVANVPEPASSTLLVISSVAVMCVRRRKS